MYGLKKNVLSKMIKYLPGKILLKKEYEHQKYIGINERVIEYEFVFKQLKKYYPKTVLDIGTGTTALPHLIRNCGFLVTAIDNIRDYWSDGMKNRHYHVIDDDITKTQVKSKFDLILCISVLEHIKDSTGAVKNMLSLLNSGGHLVLTCPYTENEYCKNVYELEGSDAFQKDLDFVCQSYSRANINEWFPIPEFQIIEQEYWELWEGNFWSTGKEVFPPILSNREDRHQLTCLVIKKN